MTVKLVTIPREAVVLCMTRILCSLEIPLPEFPGEEFNVTSPMLNIIFSRNLFEWVAGSILAKVEVSKGRRCNNWHKMKLSLEGYGWDPGYGSFTLCDFFSDCNCNYSYHNKCIVQDTMEVFTQFNCYNITNSFLANGP